MTALTAEIKSERISFTVLKAALANIDGDQANTIALPAGFGDCVLRWILIECDTFATMVTTPEVLGVGIQVVDGSATDVRDMLGVTRFQMTSAEQLQAFVERRQDHPLWRSQELLLVNFPEVDTNVAPTADLAFAIGVSRLRNLGG